MLLTKDVSKTLLFLAAMLMMASYPGVGLANQHRAVVNVHFIHTHFLNHIIISYQTLQVKHFENS